MGLAQTLITKLVDLMNSNKISENQLRHFVDIGQLSLGDYIDVLSKHEPVFTGLHTTGTYIYKDGRIIGTQG